jgi:hypothetical protein
MAKTKTETKLPYVIIRTAAAGCFAGELASRKNLPAGTSVILRWARRLWYWSGAASLSQLAMEGVSNPAGCKFPPPVEMHEVFQVTEIMHATAKCRNSIEGVSEWRA